MSKPNGSGAQVDVLSAAGETTSASGNVAQRLLESNFNVEALRTNDVLRNREWIQFDQAVINVARERLVAINDLVQAGLTYNLTNALGVTRVEWEQVSDITDANVSMSGITKGQNDRLDVALKSVPVPIVHKDFSINIRALNAYRQFGTPLDTMQAQLAARVVSEKLEAILFNGVVVGSAGAPVYGYTNAPNRVTGSVTASWALSATSGASMLTDLIAMLAALAAKNMYGPFMVYVSTAAYINMGNDLKANSDKSIIMRLKETPGIIDIKPSNKLAASAVLLVQMTSDVVDIIDGIQPTTVWWESQGGFLQNFKVLAIMVPRIKTDYAAQTGIAHYS